MKNYHRVAPIKEYCESKGVGYFFKPFLNQAGNVAVNDIFIQNPIRRTRLNRCVCKLAQGPLRLMSVLYKSRCHFVLHGLGKGSSSRQFKESEHIRNMEFKSL